MKDPDRKCLIETLNDAVYTMVTTGVGFQIYFKGYWPDTWTGIQTPIRLVPKLIKRHEQTSKLAINWPVSGPYFPRSFMQLTLVI